MRIRSSWLIVGLVVWLVAAFLLLNAPLLHMHPDEELSYRSTTGDLAHTLNYQMSVQDNQAPLWFVTFWMWQQFVGGAEYTSRVLSVLFVMLTLAIAYQLGRRWFRSAWVGMIAPLLLIGNGFFFNYGLDIRPYPLVMLCAALSMWAFTRWLDKGTLRSAVVYGLSIALLLYVHYLLVFLVIVQVIYFLLARGFKLRWLKQGLMAGGIGVGLWLPWLPTFVNQVVGLRNIEAESGTARGVAGIGVSTQATSLRTIIDLLNTATNGLTWLYGAVLLLGVILLWRKGRYWLALLWTLGVPGIALATNLVAAVYAPRFVSHILIGLALALAAVLNKLPRLVGVIGALVLIGANLLTFNMTIPVRVPYRDLYRTMTVLSQPRDIVLMQRAGENDGFVLWQEQHYLSPELHAGITTDPARAAQARRIWFMTGDWFNPDVRAVFDRLEPDYPVQQVLGQCDRAWCYLVQLLEAPPFQTPQRFGDGMDFWGADVDSVTHTAISTRLWWRVEETPDADYSMSLQLLGAGGALVVQKDGPIVHYGTETVQTSQLQMGRIYIDQRTLDLPLDLAPGDYALALIVYQPWDGVRLVLPDKSDTLLLETVTIP